MKVTIKPLKGEVFEVDVEPEEKVEEFKKKINAARPEFPADNTKLIYSGKILADEMPVSEYGIKPGEFVVVMAGKAKPAAAATEPAASPATAPAPASTEASTAPAPAADPSAPISMEQASSTLVTGSATEPMIKQLMDMGFDRPLVEQCLRAAFNNPDRAVEYCMSGIPESLLQSQEAPAPPSTQTGSPTPAAAPAPTAPAATAPGGAAPFPAIPTGGGATPFPAIPAGGGGGGGGGGGATAAALADLRNHPRFQELATMVMQNPAMLQDILPQIQATSPGLVQAIQENPEEFMRLLQEGAVGGGAIGNDPVAAMLAAAQGGGGGGGPRPQTITLSPEDEAAVDRLVQLGFDKTMAAQAYMACDKNEEMAANFLFEDSMND